MVHRRRSARGDHPRVRPRVQLLLQLRTPAGFDAHEVSSRASPARSETRRLFLTHSMPRVGFALGGRLPVYKVLLSRLSPPPTPSNL